MKEKIQKVIDRLQLMSCTFRHCSGPQGNEAHKCSVCKCYRELCDIRDELEEEE